MSASTHEPPPDRVAEDVVRTATAAGVTVAVAESLTGGAVTDTLVAVPGASVVLRGAVVAYATDVKRDVLGVDATLLAEHGAVHPDVARAMARGVRTLLGADLGVATTGVAGPDPQDGHPPGTVHVAVCGPQRCVVRSLEPRTAAPPGGRAEVRRRAREAALELLRAELALPGAEPSSSRRRAAVEPCRLLDVGPARRRPTGGR